MPYAQAHGAKLYYEDAGGDGTPVILVHANVGNSQSWAGQVPMFVAAGLRPIAFDLRTHGRSQPEPGREGDGSIAGDIAALADALGLERFYLAGTAYGAFGVLESALLFPGRLRAMVVSTSFGGLTDPEFTKLRAQYVGDMTGWPEERRELGQTYRDANPEGVRRFLAIHEQNPQPLKRQSLTQPNTLQRLAGIKVPALIVATDEDAYAPPPVMRAFADAIPGAEFVVIEGAGHSAYWEKPEEWNRAVVGFLQRY
jgi:pimeloyl-ACP methyl ester carboxylesterase